MSELSELVKPFEVAIDISKHLLTLATAILTLTITFSKDILKNTAGPGPLLVSAWVLFFLSIAGGVWLMYAANGSISGMSTNPTRTIYSPNTAVPMALQQFCFLIGLGLASAFGVVAL